MDYAAKHCDQQTNPPKLILSNARSHLSLYQTKGIHSPIPFIPDPPLIGYALPRLCFNVLGCVTPDPDVQAYSDLDHTEIDDGPRVQQTIRDRLSFGAREK